MKVTEESVALFNAGMYVAIPKDQLAQIIETNFPELKEDFILSTLGKNILQIERQLEKIFEGKQIVYENFYE